MGVEERLKAAHGALRDIADMDGGELAKNGRRLALRALAFTDADLPGARSQKHEVDSHAIAQLIERIELIVRQASATREATLIREVALIREAVSTREAVAIRETVAKPAIDTFPMKWVKLDRYVEISGDSVDSVQSRRKAGKWLDGNECKIVDGRLWINLQAVDEWIERWGKRYPVR